MLNLQNVSIVSINCLNPLESVKALKYSCKDIKFKDVFLLTDENIKVAGVNTIIIDKLQGINAYSDFVLRLNDFYNLIDSEFVLIVQDDGFVVNAELWDNDFLNYDYIGAPWPAEQDWVERQKSSRFMPIGYNQVGNGGFSLRSRKFLQLSSHFRECNGYGEDAFLCTVNYDYMINNGIKFAPVDLAKKFSYENPLENWSTQIEFDGNKHFGFHGRQFLNSQQLINLKD